VPAENRAADNEQLANLSNRILDQVDRVLVGKRDVAELLLAALLARGHVLIEDVPGVGKTTLARTIAASLGGVFQRVQFTPDLLPSDITGLTFFDQKQGEFRFRPGPVFANVLLADEINRATPRTQSALLEAMEERTVTIEGEPKALPDPFLVLATENPVELEGTFPLPEAQIDRFLMRISVGYPTHDEEDEIVNRSDKPIEVEQVTDAEDMARASAQTQAVFMSDDLLHYLTEIVRSTRSHPDVELGASPRASLALAHVARSLAAVRKRELVLPDDIRELALPVLSHRIMLSPESRLRGKGAGGVIDEILDSIPVPVEGSIGLPAG